MKEQPDAGCVPTYTHDISEALGMTPKYNHRMYSSPETYSVVIRNFDLTMDRVIELTRKLVCEQYLLTRDVLLPVEK